MSFFCRTNADCRTFAALVVAYVDAAFDDAIVAYVDVVVALH
jgi:hypothetical protein